MSEKKQESKKESISMKRFKELESLHSELFQQIKNREQKFIKNTK